MSENQRPTDEGAPAPIPGLDRLDMQRMPERDLWPELSSRLQPRRVRRWPRVTGYWALAASLAATAAGWVLLQQPAIDPRLALSPMEAAAPRGLSSPLVSVAPTPTSTATGASGMHYVSLAAQQPDQRALLKANLRIVDDAETQLRDAMVSDPQSQYLQRLMQRTEQRQQELRAMLESEPAASSGANP